MKKLYYIKQNGRTTILSHAFKENGKASKQIEVSEADYKKWKDSSYDTNIINNKMDNSKRPKSPLKQEKRNLKAKLEAGTATDEDVKRALQLIL